MFKELEEIANDLTQNIIYQTESNDYIGNVLKEKLKEVPNTFNNYICECGTLIPNQVFKAQSGKCPSCGERVQPISESDVSALYEEKRLTCPNCKTNEPYRRMTESATCKVCGSLMDVYTPYKKG